LKILAAPLIKDVGVTKGGGGGVGGKTLKESKLYRNIPCWGSVCASPPFNRYILVTPMIMIKDANKNCSFWKHVPKGNATT